MKSDEAQGADQSSGNSKSSSTSSTAPPDNSEYVYDDGDEEVVGVGAKIKQKPDVVLPAKHVLCNKDTIQLLHARWSKLVKEFYDSDRKIFDPTKIPDVYDAIKYDVLHNYEFLQNLRPLYQTARKLADFVVPSEYGVLRKDKLHIGRMISHKLIDRIKGHLTDAVDDQTLKGRVHLYFCSESHIHALRNMMLLSNMADNATCDLTLDAVVPNYLSHGVWRLYEDPSEPPGSPDRFFVNFMFSPGAALDPFIFGEEGHLLPVSRPIPITSRISLDEFTTRFSFTDKA